MSRPIKLTIAIVGGILLLLSLGLFCIAIGKGFSHEEKLSPSVVVFFNENDSIVNELQMDVKRLTDLIEEMKSDSITICVNKVPRHNNIK
ncbi:MAG: hypothetical protein IKK62_07330 [Bacteroidaceae bacterium]|nr:hypothetical protein [Bacteroidaceae bacterium]